jgi:hypothetical protein
MRCSSSCRRQGALLQRHGLGLGKGGKGTGCCVASGHLYVCVMDAMVRPGADHGVAGVVRLELRA